MFGAADEILHMKVYLYVETPRASKTEPEQRAKSSFSTKRRKIADW